FSKAKLEKRLNSVHVANPKVSALYAEFVHVVETSAPLAAEQRGVLDKLLRYGPQSAREPLGGDVFWVVPRLGTISPWSSKATDIAHICGLGAVRRVERGIVYSASGPVDDPLALRRALHDRMTESVLETEGELERLFQRAEPKPLRYIDVLAN